MTCRRCSECQGRLHHWLDNSDFGNDPDEAEHPTGNEFVCKHCEAVGDECEACDGSGAIYEDDFGSCIDCPSCVGEGIIESKPRAFEEAQ